MATAIEVLPLARVRTQLRIEEDADDAHVTGLIEAAVEFVGRAVSRNVMDRSELRRVGWPGKERPIRLSGWDMQEPEAVGWYAEGDDRTAAPTRSVEPGRWLPGIAGAGSVSELWPPSGGWPDADPTALMEVTVTLGMDADDVPEAWRQSAILIVRELYEGSGLDAIPMDSAIYRLLKPWLTWTA